MKRGLLLIALSFITFPCIISNTSKAIVSVEKQYLQFIENQFNRQNYDSCIHLSYVLANIYRNQKNAQKATDVWYSISYLYLLLDKLEDADISKKVAQQYLIAYNPNKPNYDNLYHGLYFYSLKDYKKARSYLNRVVSQLPYANSRLNALVRLCIANSSDELSLNKNENSTVKKFLCDLKQSNDTCWFGYSLGYYYVGYKYFYSNNTISSIRALNHSIDTYERCSIFTKEWIKAYRLAISAYFSFKDEKSTALYLKRILGLLNKNKLYYQGWVDYHLIKALSYQIQANYQESSDIYINIYTNFNLNDIDKRETISGIIAAFFKLENYDKVIEWYQKVKYEDLYLPTVLEVAYSYYKIGNHQISEHLVSTVENKINPIFEDYSNAIQWLLYYYQQTLNFRKSEYFYKKYISYQLQHFGPINANTRYAYSQYAYFCWMHSDYVKALENYHKAIYALLTTTYNNDFYQLPDITKSIDDSHLELDLNNKAESFYQLSKLRYSKTEELRDLKASLDNFELSLSLTHKMKMNLPREEQQLVFADLAKRSYPNVIKVCLELYKKSGNSLYANKAFEYAEKSKASLLLSTIQGANASQTNLIPQILKDKEEAIRTKSALCSKKRKDEYQLVKPDHNKIDHFNTVLFQLKQNQDSLLNIFKNKYPSYYNTRYNAEVTTPQALQKLLNKDDAVIEYSITWDFMVTYIITKTDFKIFTDTLTNSFFRDIENFHTRVSKYNFNDTRDTSIYAFAKLSNRLYNYLIKPIENCIIGKKLIIIPDDVLTQIPLEVLVASEPPFSKEIGYKDLPYIIKKHPISYSFSGTLYSINHTSATYKNTNLLAVAPSYEGINPQKKRIHNSGNLSTINGTFDEVNSIQGIFHGNKLVYRKATEAQFKKIANNYDILHLAMHGAIDNESPMFSKLIFSPSNDSVNEGFLNTYEIYNMKLHAPLVVLSACNTGSGKLHTGEGIISLARGFFSAGVKCVVMTLWSVADKSSSQLMHLFYQHLAKKENVSNALQSAKLEYLSKSDMVSSHPYFWAGYISTGNSEVSFEVKKNRFTFYTIGFFSLLILGFFIWWKRRNINE